MTDPPSDTIELHQSGDGSSSIDVRQEDDTVWVIQQ